MIGGTILWNNTADRYDPPYPNPTGYVKTELDLFNLLKTEEGIRPSQDLIIKNRSIDFIGNTYVDGKGKRISLLLACKRYLDNDKRTSEEKMDFKNNWTKAYNQRDKQDKLMGDKSHIFFTNLFKEFNEKLDGSLIRVTGVPPKRISRTTESKGLSPIDTLFDRAEEFNKFNKFNNFKFKIKIKFKTKKIKIKKIKIKINFKTKKR